MTQQDRFLGSLLLPLLKTNLPLIKNVIQSLAKSALIPLGLPAEASAANARIHKKILRSGHNTTAIIISNDETQDIMKIVKSLEDSGILLQGFSETIQNEVKKQKRGFLSMLEIIRIEIIRAGYEYK